MLQKVKEFNESAQVQPSQENIDRAHRIEMGYIKKNSGKKANLIIVKFKSYRARKLFYDAGLKKFQKR